MCSEAVKTSRENQTGIILMNIVIKTRSTVQLEYLQCYYAEKKVFM